MRLGSFENEEEAARVADKILFYLNEPFHKFNFPLEIQFLTKEEINDFIKSKTFIRTNKYLGINKNYNRWVALLYVDSVRITLGSYNSEEEAHFVRCLFMGECKKDKPSLEKFKDIKLPLSAIECLKNKINSKEPSALALA